jgi:hypothetical protein
VILPVEHQRPAWMVVLSFDPERPLDESDFRVIACPHELYEVYQRDLGQSA